MRIAHAQFPGLLVQMVYFILFGFHCKYGTVAFKIKGSMNEMSASSCAVSVR
jgi:hypothetical protein